MVELIIMLTLGTSCFLPPSAGIAVGFYGNGESSDGANRVAYSLRHANRTISGVEKLVGYLLYSYACFSQSNKNVSDDSFLVNFSFL